MRRPRRDARITNYRSINKEVMNDDTIKLFYYILICDMPYPIPMFI